jgi:hypothetical protein
MLRYRYVMVADALNEKVDDAPPAHQLQQQPPPRQLWAAMTFSPEMRPNRGHWTLFVVFVVQQMELDSTAIDALLYQAIKPKASGGPL